MKNENATFISYRRRDSRWTTRAVAERLAAHFGQRKIFMDVEAIEGGEDFVKAIDEALGQCGALLALIGDHWLIDEQGQHRLDNPNDFVRREIATALNQNKLVMPVLIDEATMPSEEDLPSELATLHRCNAVSLRHADFRKDIKALIDQLARSLNLPIASVPWLDMPWQERRDPVHSAQWLRYWHRHAEFVGRIQEMQDLNEFFVSGKQFAWYAITGPGGVGKSRLALESLFSLQGDWHRGFLKEEDRKTLDWLHWRPQVATAIVVDYAAQDPDWLVEWLDTLCQTQFECPVRVLLIERATHARKDEKQYWWKRLTTGRGAALDRVEAFYKLDAHREPQPLQVRPFDDTDQRYLLWSFLKAAGKETQMPSQEDLEIWTTLDQLTEGGRPLYIGMVAAAIAAEGIDHIRHWDRGNLLQHTLEREQDIWRDAVHQQANDKVARHAVRLIAVATACGGLTFPDEDTAAHVAKCLRDANLLNGVSTRELYETAAAMTGSGAYSLEPDLLGEYFLTTQQWSISGVEDIDERTQLRADLRSAWDINPLVCARTLFFITYDFPNYSSTTVQWLSFLTADRGENSLYGWLLTLIARDVVYVYGTAQRWNDLKRVDECVDAIVKVHRENTEIRALAGAAASNLGVMLAEQGDVAGAKGAYEKGIELGHGGAAYKLGLQLAREGDTEKAKALIAAGCTQSIELYLEDDWCLYLRAVVYLLDRKTKEARTDLTNAIHYAQAQYDKEPQDWRNTFNLALYYLTAGEFEKADRLVDEGLTGQASADRLKEALEDLKDFLLFFPNHQEAILLKHKLEYALNNQ